MVWENLEQKKECTPERLLSKPQDQVPTGLLPILDMLKYWKILQGWLPKLLQDYRPSKMEQGTFS